MPIFARSDQQPSRVKPAVDDAGGGFGNDTAVQLLSSDQAMSVIVDEDCKKRANAEESRDIAVNPRTSTGESTLYPLIFNPFYVTAWKCFGVTM